MNSQTDQSYLAAATSDSFSTDADVGVSATEAPMRFTKCFFFAGYYLNIWRGTITLALKILKKCWGSKEPPFDPV